MFHSPPFSAFALKVRNAAREAIEEGRGMAIEKVIPKVPKKFRSLAAYQLAIEKPVTLDQAV